MDIKSEKIKLTHIYSFEHGSLRDVFVNRKRIGHSYSNTNKYFLAAKLFYDSKVAVHLPRKGENAEEF